MPAPQAELNEATFATYLESLGDDAETVVKLDAAVERMMFDVVSLSPLTTPLAMDYLERLIRPLPEMTLEMGVQTVGRAYVAHMVVEANPSPYGVPDVPVLGTLPPVRKGRAPQDLLNRVVKASRRGFETICALPVPVWEGFVYGLTVRAHQVPRTSDPPVRLATVEGVARVGWILRQVDIHYGTEPERRGG
jgi:hypothetical protein